jgi:ABC-2 type transport system ATP-binding protein
MPAVIAEGLSKTYTSHKKEPGLMGAVKGLFTREVVEVKAVKEINLRIEAGERVGFLGPNGAGKTTTLKMLSGILHPTAGQARVLGYEPAKRHHDMLRRISLVMGNKNQLWWDLPAWDSFVVLKELYEVSEADFKRRTEFLIESLDLTDKIHSQVRKLSLGERMKCELVAALLHGPEVVFLDEPTLGLDVVSQKRIREFLMDMHRREQCTMLLTSHYMQDVEELCERVVVIDHGQVVYEGTLRDLADKFTDSRLVRLSLKSPVERADLERFGTVKSQEDVEVVLEIPRRDTATALAGMLRDLPVLDVATEEPSIEDVIRDLFSREEDVPHETSPGNSAA